MKKVILFLAAVMCVASAPLFAQTAVPVGGVVAVHTTSPDGHAVEAVPGSVPQSVTAAGPTTVMLKYHDETLPRFNWQMPQNYGSFVNLFLLQRFTLPNNSGFLDSMQVYIQDINQGSISFRVFPAQLVDVGGTYFYFPEFGPAIDSLFIDKSQLKMQAWNSIKFKGAIVPKEFFISAEFTISGGTNNTIVIPGDFHDLSGPSQEKSRVVMLNQMASQITMRLLDGALVESGTQKPIYSYLYMTAFADTATFSPMPAIVTTPVTKAYVNVPYKYDLHSVGVPRPAYKLINGPAGLTVEWYTGQVTWTPQASDLGDHSVTIEAFNTNGSDQQTFTISVVQPTTPKIVSYPKKMALVGEPYFYQVVATGGPPPTFSMQSGGLQGLTIDPVTGQVRMTPTAQQVGIYIVSITAKNAVGQDIQSFTFKIETTASAPVISSNPKTVATVSVPYSYQVSATGNPQPTYSLTQAPTGMTIDQMSGQISWTPGAVGNFDVKVKAENRVGSNEQAYSITVSSGATKPTFVTAPRTLAIAEQSFVDTVVATASPSPRYTLVTGPSGFRIDESKGIITWTPSRDQKGNNSVTLRAENSAGSEDLPYTIFVQTVPRITSTEEFTAKVNQQYRYQVVADATPAATFSLTQSPTGMTVDAQTGLITWTPTSAQVGQHMVTVLASNSVGSDQQQWTVDVTNATAVEPAAAAGGFALTAAYPNPLSAGTMDVMIEYTLPHEAQVSFDVRTIDGRRIAGIDGARRQAGTYTQRLAAESTLPAGVYLIVMTADNVTMMRPLTIVK